MSISKILQEKYEGVEIPFRSDDAFVNATAMCNAFGKRPAHFMQLESTKLFIAELESQTNGNPASFQIEGRNGGTWVHPDLALECARWLSPRFAIWCNRIVRKILAGEIEMKPSLPQDYVSALRALADSEETKQRLTLENAEMKPKAEFFDAVTASEDTLQLINVAKLLDIGRNKMMAFLREKQILRANNTPYQQYCDAGYFTVVESKWTHPETGESHVTLSTRVYQKGVDFIRRKLAE